MPPLNSDRFDDPQFEAGISLIAEHPNEPLVTRYELFDLEIIYIGKVAMQINDKIKHNSLPDPETI